jgi:hypothetical protein
MEVSLAGGQSMKRIMLLCLVFVLGGVAIAWAGKEAYTLAMSKDKVLCKNLLNLFNEDVKQHGELTYQHEAFTSIQWETITSIYDERYPAHSCDSLQRANFDIDNDGHSNLVLKHSGCFHDVMTDDLFVFPEDSDIISRLTPGTGGLSDMFASANRFPPTSHRYERKATKGNKGALPPNIGPVFVLQPFLWEQTFYISVTGLERGWVVIAKYRQAENIQDVCYFQHRL